MNRLDIRSRTTVASVTIVLFFAVAVPACERRPEGPPPEEPVPVAEPEPAAELYPPEVAPGFALAVEKLGARAYQMHGWTDRAQRIRVEVEDGHNVLFGPEEIPVEAEHFALDFAIQPTDRDHVFVYVTDGAGARLAVVPVDTARSLTVVGPRERLRPDGAGRPR
jgi:hypothetical protein